MFFAALSTLSLAAVALASPTAILPRDYTNMDVAILNYALTLEHLEDTFYRQGLAKFSAKDFADAGFGDSVYESFKLISDDESTHVAFLTGALKAAGAVATAECTYNFGVTDVTSFIKTASILEGVGVAAYTGAAADIMSKTYLTAAATILTVEARHSAYIRNALGQKPFPIPFGIPLTLDEVHSLASQFIVSCPPSNPPLNLKSFPILTSSPTNPAVIKTGTVITLLTPNYILAASDGKSPIYAAFITVTGPVFVVATPVTGGFTVAVPATAPGAAPIGGQTYVVLTSCNKSVTDDTVAAGPAIFEVSN